MTAPDDLALHVVRVDGERLARLEDGLVASLEGLWAADARRHDPAVATDWPAREGAEYVRGVAGDPDSVLLAACTGDAGTPTVVGHLVGRFHAADDFRQVDAAVLESMQVREDVRGTGAGASLVDALLVWAGERGAARVSVTANAGNEGAQRFYRRLGFAPAAVTMRLVLDGAGSVSSSPPGPAT